VICWIVSPGLLMWMLPVIAGLVLAGPLNWLTAQPAGPALTELLSTWDDREPPPILVRSRQLCREWERRFKGRQGSQDTEPADLDGASSVPRAA
jgi:membrane glycosyltransferase